MRPTLLVRAALAATVLFGVGACRRPTDVDPLVGTYFATTFQVAPAGQSPINVLAQGGTLGLNVAANPTAANTYIVAGTLVLPAAVTGGAPLTARATAARCSWPGSRPGRRGPGWAHRPWRTSG